MKTYDYIVSLSIRHPSLDLTETYQTLSGVPGIRPGRLCNVGEERKTVDGKPLAGLYEESRCGFGFMDKWQSSTKEELPYVLNKILDKILPYQKLIHNITNSGGSADFFIGWGINENHDVLFGWELLERITAFHIDLRFDLYPPDEVFSAEIRI